ncbi:MAG: nuclease-related domain-containing protein, partial [Solirubrobacterales bacterium]
MAAGPDDLDLGTAGAAARRELERRRVRREGKTRDAHPHLGGLLLKLQAPPQSEKSWETGAVGEEALGAHLAARCPDAVVMHDRGMPGSRANIDHIAVAPSGVFVIDSKRYKGRIEVRKPLFRDAVLVIKGRKRTKLVEGLGRQVQAVEKGLAIVEQDLAVHGCFCF